MLTPEERQDLEDEQLRLCVENLRKESEVFDARIANQKAEMLYTEDYRLPHRRCCTKVFRAPNGETWICACQGVDRGDMHTDPFGEGATPEQACADFDRNWVGDDRDLDGGLGELI